MRIELLVPRATATGAENRGDVVEVTDAEAVRMIEAGQAVAVRAQFAEKAVKPTFRSEKAKR